MLANARMYSVTPTAKAAWRELIGWVLAQAGVNAHYIDHDPPLVLSDLWAREDLGVVQMCGLPVSRRAVKPLLLAAPVPSPVRYAGRSVYMTDLAVRADSGYQSLQDTFGGVAGYTLKDSQSGYFAFRHLLATKYGNQAERYRKVVGQLVNARGIIRALAAGEIDVGPLDGYVFDLIRAGDPEFAAQVRIIESTEPTPMPPFIATAQLDNVEVQRLRDAFMAVAQAPALVNARNALLLSGFVVPDYAAFTPLKTRAHLVESTTEAWP